MNEPIRDYEEALMLSEERRSRDERGSNVTEIRTIATDTPRKTKQPRAKRETPPATKPDPDKFTAEEIIEAILSDLPPGASTRVLGRTVQRTGNNPSPKPYRINKGQALDRDEAVAALAQKESQ